MNLEAQTFKAFLPKSKVQKKSQRKINPVGENVADLQTRRGQCV